MEDIPVDILRETGEGEDSAVGATCENVPLDWQDDPVIDTEEEEELVACLMCHVQGRRRMTLLERENRETHW